MPTGTVKWFDDEKGYGFIRCDTGGPDVFVHFSGIKGDGHRALQQGQQVRYEEMDGKRGVQATEVEVVA